MKKNIKKGLLLLVLYLVPFSLNAHNTKKGKILAFSIGSGYNLYYGIQSWKESENGSFKNASKRKHFDALTFNGELNLLFTDDLSAGASFSKSPQFLDYDNFSVGIQAYYNLFNFSNADIFLRAGLNMAEHMEGDCKRELFSWSSQNKLSDGEVRNICTSDVRPNWLNFPKLYGTLGIGMDLFSRSNFSIQPYIDLKLGAGNENFIENITPATSFNILFTLRI